MEHQPDVQLRPPPKQVIRVVNPLVRRMLRSRFAALMPATMALLELTGRRSGRPMAIPVGLHRVSDGPVVFTEAPWRFNFESAREVTVTRGASRRRGNGRLVEDPQLVADALGQAVELVGARSLALRTTPGHPITRDDLLRLGRNMVRLDLVD